jgi:carboxyl-terminal processing protease
VAGSFQDLDRGVIMGQKSFGKGLVQKVYKLSYNSQVKITVAKYYIPSGRCIQALDYQHKDAGGHASRTADSLQAVFKTHNGRPVKDAGGILPDVPLEKEEWPVILSNLRSQYLIFDFATRYVLTHDSIKDPANFEITDALYEEFVHFTKDKDFNYRTYTDAYLEKLEKNAKEDGYYDELKMDLDEMKANLDSLKQQEIYTYKELIKEALHTELISRYYYLPGKISAQIIDDDEVKAAQQLLNNSAKYQSILQGSAKE